MAVQLPLDALDLSPTEVRRRFRWARRQGRAAWLWPDLDPDTWRDALRQIVGVVRHRLTNKSGRPMLDGDARAIGIACYTSGTGPLLGWWHEQGQVDASDAIAAELELHLRHNRLRTERLTAAAVELVDLLADRNVRVAVLKGAHTAHDYFPEPGTRPVADIDLLVDAADARKAETAMRDRGYLESGRNATESSWRLPTSAALPRSLRLTHADDPWTIDLHRSLDIPLGSGAPVVGLDGVGPMSGGKRWRDGLEALRLEQPLLLLHLAAHAGMGFQNLTLIRLIELHLVISADRASGSLDWNAFVDLGAEVGALGFAYPALKLCDDLVPHTVPAQVLDHCARHAPRRVLQVVKELDPAMAQRIDRNSIAEHFMWADGIAGRARQLVADMAPARSLRALWPIYERRMWQLLRGRISR